MLFASILNSTVVLGNYVQKTTSADIFRCIFLGALRVNWHFFTKTLLQTCVLNYHIQQGKNSTLPEKRTLESVYVQWTIPSLLYLIRRKNPLVYKGLIIEEGKQVFIYSYLVGQDAYILACVFTH